MNRVIVASGEFNQVTRQWKSIVCIFWKSDTQKLHSINDLPGIFGTEKEAVAYALQTGKHWIDTQPVTFGPGPPLFLSNFHLLINIVTG